MYVIFRFTRHGECISQSFYNETTWTHCFCFVWHSYFNLLEKRQALFWEMKNTILRTICFNVPVIWISLGTLCFVPQFCNSLTSIRSRFSFLFFIVFALTSTLLVSLHHWRRVFRFFSYIQRILVIRELKIIFLNGKLKFRKFKEKLKDFIIYIMESRICCRWRWGHLIWIWQFLKVERRKN